MQLVGRLRSDRGYWDSYLLLFHSGWMFWIDSCCLGSDLASSSESLVGFCIQLLHRSRLLWYLLSVFVCRLIVS